MCDEENCSAGPECGCQFALKNLAPRVLQGRETLGTRPVVIEFDSVLTHSYTMHMI